MTPTCIRTKSIAVRLNLTSPAIVRLVVTLAEVGQQLAGHFDGDLVITSGHDGMHGPQSRHYRDEAIDIRTHNFRSREAVHHFRAAYEAALGPQFRVLLEDEGLPNEHLHAQVRKGLTYQPEAAMNAEPQTQETAQWPTT